MPGPILVSTALLGTVLSLGAGLAIATDEGRGPAMQALQGISADGRTLVFSVNSCHGDPEATVTEEDAGKVVVSVVSDIQTGEGPACADGVSVRLSEPLGTRQVIDAATARSRPGEWCSSSRVASRWC